MPDAKYFDRPGMGNGNYNLGWDNEDLPSTAPKPAMEHEVMAMPTEQTVDKQRNQDGNAGKPFFKTLASRQGPEDSTSGLDKSMGGPNAQ